MGYFRLKDSIDVGTIGATYPQSQEFKTLINVNAPEFIWNTEVPLPDNVYIPKLILDQKAKATDLISSSSIRYPLVSQKLKDCISELNCNKVKWWLTKLIVKNSEIDIFMISGITKGFEYLDLDYSEIDLLEKFKFFKRLNFTKVEELENAVKGVQYPNTIAINKCSLKNTDNQDLIYIENVAPSGGVYLFSERLKEKIVQSGCTGIEFEPLE